MYTIIYCRDIENKYAEGTLLKNNSIYGFYSIVIIYIIFSGYFFFLLLTVR